MKILKASAGSGKTYQLSHQYIDLLMASTDRYAYRNILAVTFTNKATAEMKERILRDLHEMSKENPKARQILTDILHDYSAFSISTIDKFFQRALKAFSREIGQFADYQIELDRKALIAESMDRILDSLTEDQTELVSYLKSSIADQLALGKKLKLEDMLYEMGIMLKSEQHRNLCEQQGIDDSVEYGKTRLQAVSKCCRDVIEDFEKNAAALGVEVVKGEKIRYPNKTTLKKNPELNELFAEKYADYLTAFVVNNQLFSLGLAGEFYRSFDQLLKEKNLMCLDESNTILRDIIDGSDAPFVYEKLGVRYKNFLLDEFQDTSNIQWKNFLPLLLESESNGGSNLLVGDIKQSIYRFRDSEWKLLGSQVQTDFPNADIKSLQDNYRSLGEIVRFNNGFFKYAADQLGLADIYSDVAQNTKKEEPGQSGYVRLTFCDDQIAQVLDSVRKAHDEQHARWSDIAILVRGNAEGADIAGALIAQGIPVISDDSLNISSSVVVRRLVSILNFYNNPDDTVGAYLAQSLNLEIPRKYHSLIDMCESLLRSLRESAPEQFDAETLYIQAFMDQLQEWTTVNGNDIPRFLKSWSEKEHFIGSPEQSESVRVLTIHKSKGLQYPFVIFPFADKVKLYKYGTRWCYLDDKPLDGQLRGLYPVALTKEIEQTHFNDSFEKEHYDQKVDNINVFYVALTRATKQMHIISVPVSKKFKESIKGTNCDPSSMPELLYAYCGQFDECHYGQPYDFGKMKREAVRAEHPFESVYASIPLGDRLAPSDDACDFFGDSGATGPEASARLNGLMLHGILSKVNVPQDLDEAIDSAVTDGALPKARASEVHALLSQRIAAHPQWFCSQGRNEISLINLDGQERRPDRVIETSDQTLIIDYKFGQKKEKYFYQVAEYVNLYRKMGFKNVKGILWYVQEDETQEII